MKTRLPCVLFFGLIIFGIANAVPLNSDEAEAKRFVQDASEKFIQLYNGIFADILSLYSDETRDLYSKLNMIVSKTHAMLEIVKNAKKFDHTKFKDEELRSIFEKIRKSANGAIVAKIRMYYIILTKGSLEDLATERDIEGYKNKNITLAYSPDIENIFNTSNDPEELKYYWNAWREKNSKRAMSAFFELASDIGNHAADLNESSITDCWMKNYNMTEMDSVMNQIKPFYRQLHAFLRNQLNRKYGDFVIQNDGLIPDHLFQQVLAQTWASGSILEENFPHKDLPRYDTIVKQTNNDAMKLYKTADKFYESMGFSPVPDNYWETRLRKQANDETECRATIYSAPRNVFMQYCQNIDFKKFLQAHTYMAEIHYVLKKSDLPAYYFDSYGLEYSVGEAVRLSASSPKHLGIVGIVKDNEITERVLMNRLMRQSIEAMLNIPVYYVQTKLMADFLARKIEYSELSKYYWQLMDEYVGVGPPLDREPNTFDFPFKFYLDLNENELAKKFNSKVLSYQFYKKLCAIAGQYPKEPMQNCDFYGSKDAGDALKKMMKLGSSKRFSEVLEAILPEDPKMNAESLLEYYFPVLSWLTEANQRNGVQIGWKHSDKKIGSIHSDEYEYYVRNH